MRDKVKTLMLLHGFDSESQALLFILSEGVSHLSAKGKK
jgi:hypothetical protein